VSRVDHQRVALRAPEINGRRQAGDPAADDDDFAQLRVVEILV